MAASASAEHPERLARSHPDVRRALERLPAGSALREVYLSVVLANPFSARAVAMNVLQLAEDFGDAFAPAAECPCRLALRLAEALGRDASAIGASYKRIVMEFIRDQRRFASTGRYPAAGDDYDAVIERVYRDDAYMPDYMLELLATYGLWHNKHRLWRSFLDDFLPRLDPRGGRLGEIGPGHGLFLAEALRRCPRWAAAACDISPAAARLTRRALELSDLPPQCWEVLDGDATALGRTRGPFDALIFSEVVEHVPDPANLLAEVRGMLAGPESPVFFVTAINTAAPDHLVLFTEPQEVRRMLADAGFAVADEGVYPPVDQLNATSGQLKQRRTPLVYAAVLTGEGR